MTNWEKFKYIQIISKNRFVQRKEITEKFVFSLLWFFFNKDFPYKNVKFKIRTDLSKQSGLYCIFIILICSDFTCLGYKCKYQSVNFHSKCFSDLYIVSQMFFLTTTEDFVYKNRIAPYLGSPIKANKIPRTLLNLFIIC